MKYLNALYPATLFHNTFLFSILSKKSNNYDRVKKWTKNYPKGLFSFDKIVIPINTGNRHWTVCCIDLIKKEISYYDSMGSGSSKRNKVYNTCLDYIECEYNLWADRVELEPFHRQDYTSVHNACAQQSDGSSCGVYTCLFAKRLGEDNELTFSINPTQFRVKLAYDLTLPFIYS